MDIKQLQQLVTLSETLNFRRAAERLNIAQPALSVSLRKLERELGVRLFDRGRHGVAVTPAGAAALPEAVRAIEYAARVKRQARAGAEGRVGTARLGFVGSAAYDVLPRVLVAFRNRHPDVDVELHERTTGSLQEELLRDELDIGIVRYPTLLPSSLRMEEIQADQIGVALWPGHPLARNERVALAELADEPFVFPSATLTPSLFSTNMARCRMAGFAPRIVQEASEIQTTIGLVQGGVGVALIPSLAARNAWQRIAFRPLSDAAELLATGLALVHSPDRICLAAQHFRRVALEVAGVDPSQSDLSDSA